MGVIGLTGFIGHIGFVGSIRSIVGRIYRYPVRLTCQLFRVCRGSKVHDRLRRIESEKHNSWKSQRQTPSRDL